MNKQQIILLALLVSFVSSIATAISVVSLMQQDQNVPVTQTINNVVERTIERVTADATKPSAPSVVTKETIVVKEDEAVVNAIESATKGIVGVYSIDPLSSGERFVGMGIIASSTGRIIAKTEVQYGGSYTVHLKGGNVVPVTFVSYDSLHGIALFQALQSDSPTDARVYAPAAIADSGSIKPGQSVIVIANSENLSVAEGIVSTVDQNRQIVRTSVKEADTGSQALLVNLSGEIVGIRDANSFDGGFIPDSIIKTYATP